MKILVTYGSKRGGTEGLARSIADGLRGEGLAVDVAPAGHLRNIAAYDAVIVGGALYAGRWHKDARRFVKRHSHDLRLRPTYFFSSGPLDASAGEQEIEPVRGVAALMESIGARGHATFGGRLLPDARGFVAAAMSKKMAGDWRDAEQARAWARKIARSLGVEDTPYRLSA